MKREIKFKAKRNNDEKFGEWVECDSFIAANETMGINAEIYDRFGKWVEVDEETICQYTGLKDKNGVEIYEGDNILNMGTSGNSITSRGVVVYDSEGAAFKIKEDYREMWNGTEVSPKSYLVPFLSTLKYEVIGNIHD